MRFLHAKGGSYCVFYICNCQPTYHRSMYPKKKNPHFCNKTKLIHTMLLLPLFELLSKTLSRLFSAFSPPGALSFNFSLGPSLHAAWLESCRGLGSDNLSTFHSRRTWDSHPDFSQFLVLIDYPRQAFPTSHSLDPAMSCSSHPLPLLGE